MRGPRRMQSAKETHLKLGLFRMDRAGNGNRPEGVVSRVREDDLWLALYFGTHVY